LTQSDGYPDFPTLHFDYSVQKRLPVGVALEQEFTPWHNLSFAFFSTQGTVFCADSMWEDARLESQDIARVGFFSTILTMFDAILFAREYYPALGYEGTVQVRYSQESAVPRIVSSIVRQLKLEFSVEIKRPLRLFQGQPLTCVSCGIRHVRGFIDGLWSIDPDCSWQLGRGG
jgi:hypothetical protein